MDLQARFTIQSGGMNQTTNSLEVEHVSRWYGSRQSVSDLSFVVRPGEVVGFLGPNGAGKTTTIRMCLNLIRPTSGSVRVFGEAVGSGSATLGRVGCLIESAAVLPFLSGRDNLEFLRRARGRVGAKAVDRALVTVNLADRAGDRVRTYSLGMRQRLGLALALLSDPDLLILDEPANGLDPAGIVEMRDLLRRLASEGKAILVSSHVLREVEETCDRVVIINLGRLVREAAMRDLLSSAGMFAVRVARPNAALAEIQAHSWGKQARLRDGLVITPSPTGQARDLSDFLFASGHIPEMITEDRHELEDIFLDLTHEEGSK
jgi:ABC-2 type transport system ATP-binding protein